MTFAVAVSPDGIALADDLGRTLLALELDGLVDGEPIVDPGEDHHVEFLAVVDELDGLRLGTRRRRELELVLVGRQRDVLGAAAASVVVVPIRRRVDDSSSSPHADTPSAP